MRLRPTILLLILLAAPLAGAATDPGARDPIGEEGAATTDGGVSSAEGRVLLGTRDPGSNANPLQSNRDVDTWYVFDSEGVLQQESGGVDPEVCSGPTTGLESGEDCSTDVVALRSDDSGTRIVAVGLATPGAIVVFKPFDGSLRRILIEDALEVAFVDVDDDGDKAAVAYRQGVDWFAVHIDLNDASSPLGDPSPLTDRPTALDMAADGSGYIVTHGEIYDNYHGNSAEPFRRDNQFSGTPESGAIASDERHTSVTGTNNGRLLFRDDQTSKNDQLLNFRRASSPITEVAMADYPDGDDSLTVAWSNEAGTLGFGAYGGGGFQILREFELGAEASHIEVNRDGSLIGVVADGDVYLYARAGDDVYQLWRDTDPGPLAANARVSLTNDGEMVAVPTTAGVRIYDAIHNLTVTGDRPTLTPGVEGEMVLSITNIGNRLEETTLDFEDLAGWSFKPESGTVVVPPGKTVDVPVAVTSSPSADPTTHDVLVFTKGVGGKDLEHTVQLRFERVVDWEIGLREGASQTLSVEAGEPSTFELYVQNKGNTPLSAPLRLGVSDGDWRARFDSGTGTIDAGARVDLDVVVTPPSNALELEEATVTVRVDGFDEPLELRAVVGAVFDIELDAPAGIEVEDGSSKTFNITVRNLGNTEDSVRLSLGDLPAGWSAGFQFGLEETSVKGIPARGERTVSVTLTVPAGEELGVPSLVEIEAVSFGDADNVVTKDLLVTVVEPTPDDPGEESPGVGALLLLALLGAAAVVARRR